MKVGLFFGSFNPVHVGHLVIANHIAKSEDVDQVWLVVSPENPHKKKETLLADYHRLALVNVAVDDNPMLRGSNIEFKLPVPSYTVTTLTYLKEKYPTYTFSLIMGEDNIRTFHKWFNYQEILENYPIYVYPRALTAADMDHFKHESSHELLDHPNVHFCEDVPVMKISSSYIRGAIRAGKDVRYLLTDPVLNYIDEMNFYR